MQVEDMVLISVDDHVVEPPSMSEYFEDQVPAKFRDRVPGSSGGPTARTPG